MSSQNHEDDVGPLVLVSRACGVLETSNARAAAVRRELQEVLGALPGLPELTDPPRDLGGSEPSMASQVADS